VSNTKYNIKFYQKSTLEGGIINSMPNSPLNYPTMQYPLASDPVNVHGDFKVLVDALTNILPPLGYGAAYIDVRNTSGTTISQGTPVFISGSISGKSLIKKYDPSSPSHNPDVPILGLAKDDIPHNSNGLVIVSGVIQMNTTGLGVAGTKVYVDGSGTLVEGRPSTGPARYIAVVAIQATLTLGGMLIVQTKGNGTWGALKDGLS
jgi:hypothetical protein